VAQAYRLPGEMFRAAGAPRSSQTTGPYFFGLNIQRELKCLYERGDFYLARDPLGFS